MRKADTENGLIRGFFSWYQQSPEERRDQRTSRPPWWALPTKNTLDRATATLPKLLYERLDDIGIDFTVLYPTLGLLFPHLNRTRKDSYTCSHSVGSYTACPAHNAAKAKG